MTLSKWNKKIFEKKTWKYFFYLIFLFFFVKINFNWMYDIN